MSQAGRRAGGTGIFACEARTEKSVPPVVVGLPKETRCTGCAERVNSLHPQVSKSLPVCITEPRMKPHHCFGVVLFALAGILPGFTDDKKPDVPAGSDGFVPMFNGKDLTGWVNVNCAPGTFFVKDGEIITTGKPTGYLRTAKQYENFIAEFDWMHIPPKSGEVGNSGFFVWADPIPATGTGYTRGIEVQVLVN